MQILKLSILIPCLCKALCGVMLAMAISCQMSKISSEDRYIAPYTNLSGLCFYSSPAGDKLFITFFDGNSFVNCTDMISNTYKTGRTQILEVSFIQSKSNQVSSKFVPIEGGRTLVVVPFKRFDQRTCKVLYSDEESIHEIIYAGVRPGDFEPYRLPKTPKVIGDPFR